MVQLVKDRQNINHYELFYGTVGKRSSKHKSLYELFYGTVGKRSSKLASCKTQSSARQRWL